MIWKVITTDSAPAKTIMQKDAELLESLAPQDPPIIHLYEWKNDSATYGYFVRPQNFLNLEKAQKQGLDLAQRPTGGGIVFHAWDWAFSVLVPSSCAAFSVNTLDNYGFVNQAVLQAVKKFLKQEVSLSITKSDAMGLDADCGRFCMAKPTKYDVMLGSRKIAGAAQRKKKNGFLHQGTIALSMPSENDLQEILLPGTRVFEAMQSHTFALLQGKVSKQDLKEARGILRTLLIESLSDHLASKEQELCHKK